MTLVLVVGKLISMYTGYKRDCRKEDDIRVKNKIIVSLTNSQNHLKNLDSIRHRKDQDAVSFDLKRVKDESDAIIQIVEYSLSGHLYPFFSSQTSVGSKVLKKLIEYDYSIATKSNDIENLSNALVERFIDEGVIDSLEVKNLLDLLSQIRFDFGQRIDLIKRTT
jgi:hypothetical protein